MINRRKGSSSRLSSSPSSFEESFDRSDLEKPYSPKDDRRACQVDLKLRIHATRYFVTLVALCIATWTVGQIVQVIHHSQPYPIVLSENGEDVCLRKITRTTERFWIAMPAWDDPAGLHRALQSVMDQQQTGFDEVLVVVFEDKSNSMFTDDQKDYYRSSVNVTFLQNTDSATNLGSAYGKWKIFERIRDLALPHEYVLVLDGDDVLADEYVLRDVQETLQAKKPWFAWGRHNGKYSEQCGDLRLRRGGTIRQAVWSFCHPRIFQSHLLQHIEARDFQREDGSWLQKATDRPFIFKFMEMAARGRMYYFGRRPLYNYTMGSHNGLKIFQPDVINGDKDLVNGRPAADRESETVHVITCVYDRQNTHEFFERLMKSKLNKGMSLSIHVCNNKSERQGELEAVATRVLERWRLLQIHMHNTIHIHDMGGNFGGYSRFLLARKVMQTQLLDYLIMIDDDQLVNPHTIQQAYRAREPRTFKAWYGKNWYPQDRSYWKPWDHMSTDPAKRYKERPRVRSWQYGGTGMSIIDAAIFLRPDLFEIEKKYLFVEDVWLSYLVQLLGWKIERLFVNFDDAGHEFRTSTGQWTHLKPLKEQFFQRLGFLACNKKRAAPAKADQPFIAA